MWQSRWVILFLLLFPLIEPKAETTSAGPTSAEEAQSLWSTAGKAMEEFRFQDAVNEIQRYVDRYPGEFRFIEAHLWLGKAYLGLRQANKALPPLKYYVEAMGEKVEAFRGRVWLGRAYVQAGKYQEALLTALEIQRLGAGLNLPNEILQEGLLVQSSARIALKDPEGAEQILTSLENQLSSSDVTVRGEYFRTRLQLQNALCALISARSHLRPLDEAQIRLEMDREGSCVQRSLNYFQKALALNHRETAQNSLREMRSIYQTYTESCLHPPVPKKAQLELADFLARDCKRQTQEGLKQLSNWETPLSPPVQEIANQFKSDLSGFLIHHTR